MGAVKIRAKSGVLIGGKPFEAGAVVAVAPLDAAEVLRSGRGELVHAGDAEAVREAVRADTLRALKAAGRPWRGPEVSAPWQRRA